MRFEKGPYAQRVTDTTAEVRVELSLPSPLTVEVDDAKGAKGAKGTDAGITKVTSRELTTFHVVKLEGLRPGTVYSFAVAAGSARASFGFTTAPRNDSKAPFRYLVYGDNRTDAASHSHVVRAMADVPADFLVHTGDFVEDGGLATDWQQFFDIEAPLLKRTCLYGTVGNHELVDKDATYFLKYFAFGPKTALDGGARPPISGTFRWGNSRFFLFNAMTTYTAGEDRAWLERALDASDAEAGLVWRALVVHHAPWSSGPHGDNRAFLEADLPALFRKHKVDIVFGGHDHIYERGFNEGLAYVISGGGGAPSYTLGVRRPMVKKAEASRHFVEVTTTSEALSLVVRRSDGSVLEKCALPKGKPWDCDSPEPPASPPPEPPSPPPAAKSCLCEVALGRSEIPSMPFAGLALVVPALAFVRRASRRDER